MDMTKSEYVLSGKNFTITITIESGDADLLPHLRHALDFLDWRCKLFGQTEISAEDFRRMAEIQPISKL